jgi:hypothetical protein
MQPLYQKLMLVKIWEVRVHILIFPPTLYNLSCFQKMFHRKLPDFRKAVAMSIISSID